VARPRLVSAQANSLGLLILLSVVRFTELGNSGGSALVSMVRPADPEHRDDPTKLRRFNGSSLWSIFPKRRMTTRTVIVVEVGRNLPA
jgi:hypothetical protein